MHSKTLKMKILFSMLSWLLLNHVITTNGASEHIVVRDGAWCKNYWYFKVDKCMPDGYIHHWRCDGPWNRPHWRRMKEHDKHCAGKYPRCLCERIAHVDFDNYICKCVEATLQPDFPSTGILEISQRVRFIHNEFAPWIEVEARDKIHRYVSGHYLRKYAEFDWYNATLPWEYKFEIYVPMKNGKFKKYAGKMKDGICRTKIVNNEGAKFDELWDEKHLHTLSKNFQQSKTIKAQVWERTKNDYYIDVTTRSKWTLNFDASRNVAIPVSESYSYSDDFEHHYRHLTRTFKFTDVVKGQVSFDVNNYCKNRVSV